MADALWEQIKARYDGKEELDSTERLRRIERHIMLEMVDTQWKDHLYSHDRLKEGIGLRGYGQRDPLVEYKKESFALFQDMKARIEEEMVRYLFHLRASIGDDGSAPPPATRRAPSLMMSHPAAEGVPAFAGARAGGASARQVPAEFGGGAPRPARTGGDDVVKTVRHEGPKVGRNDPCPCGSGKKYKKCHGTAA
jgi:preprotein translocase subunit SecA